VNIPDGAIEAAVRALAEEDGEFVHEDDRAQVKQRLAIALSAALPAIERAHLERLTAEAEKARGSEPQTYWRGSLSAFAARWLRVRLDQTKEEKP
jgi:hypothetical protein